MCESPDLSVSFPLQSEPLLHPFSHHPPSSFSVILKLHTFFCRKHTQRPSRYCFFAPDLSFLALFYCLCEFTFARQVRAGANSHLSQLFSSHHLLFSFDLIITSHNTCLSCHLILLFSDNLPVKSLFHLKEAITDYLTSHIFVRSVLLFSCVITVVTTSASPSLLPSGNRLKTKV